MPYAHAVRLYIKSTTNLGNFPYLSPYPDENIHYLPDFHAKDKEKCKKRLIFVS